MSGTEKGWHSLWDAPVGSQSESLIGLEPPNREEAQEFIEGALGRRDKRYWAYRTQVTDWVYGRRLS